MLKVEIKLKNYLNGNLSVLRKKADKLIKGNKTITKKDQSKIKVSNTVNISNTVDKQEKSASFTGNFAKANENTKKSEDLKKETKNEMIGKKRQRSEDNGESKSENNKRKAPSPFYKMSNKEKRLEDREVTTIKSSRSDINQKDRKIRVQRSTFSLLTESIRKYKEMNQKETQKLATKTTLANQIYRAQKAKFYLPDNQQSKEVEIKKEFLPSTEVNNSSAEEKIKVEETQPPFQMDIKTEIVQNTNVSKPSTKIIIENKNDQITEENKPSNDLQNESKNEQKADKKLDDEILMKIDDYYNKLKTETFEIYKTKLSDSKEKIGTYYTSFTLPELDLGKFKGKMLFDMPYYKTDK